MNLRTKDRVTLYTLLLVAIMGAMLVGVGYYEISHTLYQQILSEQESRLRVAKTLLAQEGTPLEIRKGQLYAGKILINGNADLVDRITQLVGGTTTIYQGETRVATNVRMPDGTRALGTKLAHDKAREVLFEKGENYRGATRVLGESYLSAYEVLKNPQGETIGALQVGAWKSAYNQTLKVVLARGLFIALVGVLLTGLIVYMALHNLTRDLQEVVSASGMLLESTGEGLYGVDLQGRCTFINHTGAELLGYKPEELVGKNLHATIHHAREGGANYPLVECDLCSKFATEKIRRHDEVFWRKDGTSFHVRYHSSPMEKDGASQGAVVVFNDITERRKTEAEIRNTLSRAVGGGEGVIYRRRSTDRVAG